MQNNYESEYVGLVGVWLEDRESKVTSEDLVMRGENEKEIVQKILNITAQGGFIKIFEINEKSMDANELKIIHVINRLEP